MASRQTCVARLGGEEDRAGGILARRLAAVAGLGDRIDVGARRIQRHIHVGELALHELELADRPAELLSLVHIGKHHVERRLHQAERPGGEHRALVVEAGHQHADALPDLAEHVLLRHLAILKDQLAGLRAAHAELVELLGDGETRESSSRR